MRSVSLPLPSRTSPPAPVLLAGHPVTTTNPFRRTHGYKLQRCISQYLCTVRFRRREGVGLGLTEKNDNNTARGCRRMGERGLEMTGITTSWVLRQTEMSIRRCLAMPSVTNPSSGATPFRDLPKSNDLLQSVLRKDQTCSSTASRHAHGSSPEEAGSLSNMNF